MKKCCRCKIKKPFKEFSFNRAMADGRQPYCKRCAGLIDADYRKKLRSKILNSKRQRRWQKSNKEKLKEKNRIYYQKNKEKIMCRRNSECLVIIENTENKKINRNRQSNVPKYNYDIVLDPKPKEVKNGKCKME